MRNIFRFVSITIFNSSLLVSFQNCGGKFSADHQGTNSIDQMSVTGSQSAKFDCQFVGVETLRARLSATLGIQSQDVPILNDNGTPSNRGRIETNKASLGEADPKIGKYADYSCEMTKFKLSTEIMVDACKQAMSNTDIKAKLFPKGSEDYDQLFLTFLGRLPSTGEIEVLSGLTDTVADDNKEAAACAATAMSFEALTRI